MGGPVFRGLAAALTVGTSEAIQKKPFQDLGKDQPVGSGMGLTPYLRLIPGVGGVGSGAAALLSLNETLIKPDEEPTVLGESDEERKRRLDEAAKEERRLRSGKGR